MSVPPLPLERLKKLIAACNPALPLKPGDPYYVELDKGTTVRGGDGASCIDALKRTIDLREPTDTSCQLFGGFPGSGKTTELLRLKARLERDDLATRVVFVEALDYIDRYNPITITDILRMSAHALDTAAGEAEARAAGKPFDPTTGYLRSLFNFLQTDLELKSIGFEAYGVKLIGELKDNPTFRQRAEQALALRFQQFATEAKQVMTEAVVRLRKAAGAQRVVLIIDSLEKLGTLREEDRSRTETSAETTFAQQADWLKPPCHAILTFPLWLRYRAPLGTVYDEEPQVLPMVKITELGPARTPYAPGVAKMVELIEKRINDLEAVFAKREHLETLVLASGGFPRDLLRMVGGVLHQTTAFPASLKDVERVVDRTAEAYSMMLREPARKLLQKIAKDHALPREDADAAVFGRLVEQWLVLAYRNGKEWYDVHPLVRRAIEEP